MTQLIPVGALITVNVECLTADSAAEDCTLNKQYEVIPYSNLPEYQEADADCGGSVSFLDDVGEKVTVFNSDVTQIN